MSLQREGINILENLCNLDTDLEGDIPGGIPAIFPGDLSSMKWESEPIARRDLESEIADGPHRGDDNRRTAVDTPKGVDHVAACGRRWSDPMPDVSPTDPPRTALVLGGGGPVGISWLTGLSSGLRDAGIDLSSADRIIGTSAGAVVGAVLAGDGDLRRLLIPLPPNPIPVPREFGPLLEIARLLRTRGPEREQAIRRAAELAISTATGDQDAHISRIGSLIGFADWPDHDLVVTSVDLTTGELRPWTRDGVASLVQAVASSTSVPGVFPPILIGGHHYIDGGVRSPINADLAADADTVVILEPLAHLFPRTRADRELGAAREVSIVPDADAIAAFGVDLFADAALKPAYEAGVRQAGAAAAQLKEVLPGS